MASFGVHSEVGKLRTVIVHRPDLSLKRLTPGNHDELLFDDVLWVERAQWEHDQFVARMRERGVEVLYVQDLLTEALATGDLVKARSAAYVAHVSDPDGESTRLCLAHVTQAEGNEFEAERILREEVCNRPDDGDAPMELSERTKTIISTHGWLAS